MNTHAAFALVATALAGCDIVWDLENAGNVSTGDGGADALPPDSPPPDILDEVTWCDEPQNVGALFCSDFDTSDPFQGFTRVDAASQQAEYVAQSDFVRTSPNAMRIAAEFLAVDEFPDARLSHVITNAPNLVSVKFSVWVEERTSSKVRILSILAENRALVLSSDGEVLVLADGRVTVLGTCTLMPTQWVEFTMAMALTPTMYSVMGPNCGLFGNPGTSAVSQDREIVFGPHEAIIGRTSGRTSVLFDNVVVR